MVDDKIWDRRKFLKALSEAGVCVSAWKPLTLLFGSLLQGAIQRAEASELGISPRNFLFIYLFGGPPRWYFDLPLDPLNTGRFRPGLFMNTTLEGGGTEYKQSLITAGEKTILMPGMWAHDVPRPGGGVAPMADLLTHMMVLRGISMGGGDHTIAQRLLRPVPDVASLDGAVADSSNTPIPAIDFGGPGLFKSLTGKGVRSVPLPGTSTTTDNAITRVMSPFIDTGDGITSAFTTRRKALEIGIDSVFTALKNYAATTQPGARALYADRQSAQDLIVNGVGDLGAAWTSLYGKYSTILNRCNDLSLLIPHPVVKDELCRDAEFQAHNADLRTVVTSGARIRNWAEQLSVIEFLFTRGLASTVTLKSSGIERLVYDGYTTFADPKSDSITGTSTAKLTREYSGDEHFGRPKMSMVCNTAWFYHIATGLYELIQSLKAANVFDDTVIQLGSEFSRIPRTDKVGSEHASTTGQLTLFSGAIKQPLILGNVNIGKSSGYTGSIGDAAPLRHEGADTILRWEHAISTAATVLRIPSPTANFRSVVTEQNGSIIPVVGPPENLG